MRKKILIVGAGQLGSRYLQGMTSVRFPLDIWVVDISVASLERAKQRWDEVAGDKTEHSISYITALNDVPKSLDMVIVSTSSDVRANVVMQIAQFFDVRYWILEKVLAQNYKEVIDISTAVKSAEGAWVNTPMHMWSLYKNIRDQYTVIHPIIATFEGFRGLACNAIHYIDFVSRWNNEYPITVDTSYLADQWHPAERHNFWEIFGSLLIKFMHGSELTLISTKGDRQYRVTLRISCDEWHVDEKKGLARSSTGKEIQGKCEFQSQLTSPLVESIFVKGTCDLPTLEASAVQHRIFLDSMISHWNNRMIDHRNRLPIT